MLWALVWGNIFGLRRPRGGPEPGKCHSVLGCYAPEQPSAAGCRQSPRGSWLDLRSYPVQPRLHFAVQIVFLSPIQLQKPYLWVEVPR